MGVCVGDDELTLPTERVALVVWLLVHGERLTSREAGHRLGLTTDGAAKLLKKVSLVVPLYDPEDNGGYWEIAEYDGADGE